MTTCDPKVRLQDLWPIESDGPAGTAEHEILRVAIRAFGRRGYRGTSTRAIAAEASVTAPLIGYHFGSKEGLFRCCADVVFRSMTESVLERNTEAEPLVDVVRWFAAVHLHFAHSYPDALRFGLSLAYGPEEAQPDIDIVSSWAPAIEWISTPFARAIETGEFVPREGLTLARLIRHLTNIVHLEVFSSYERERFGPEIHLVADLYSAPNDLVGDIVEQFFNGAGALHFETQKDQRS